MIRWLGQKSAIMKALLGEANKSFSNVVEPFAGSAAASRVAIPNVAEYAVLAAMPTEEQDAV